jgi:plasmid replication initiation protein
MTEVGKTNTSTLDRRQNEGDLVKPVELIAVKGSEGLGLIERRIYNLLIKNAFGPDLAEAGKHFKISTAELRDAGETNEQLVQSLEKLMRSIVTVRRSDGSTDRVQLLGWNNLTHPDRPHGSLTYSIPPELAKHLENSTLFARLEVTVLRNFTSKYAMALYEQVSQWVRLSYVHSKIFTVDELRDVLGVPEGKLTTFGNLNRNAIKPALLEVNALADFTVSLLPTKTARKITGVCIGWSLKDEQGKREAYSELQRPKVGRLARISGTVEVIE